MKVFLFLIFTISILIAPKDNGANEKRESELFEYYWNGILMTESDKMHFKNWKIVLSPKGAVGISQIMPYTAYDIIRWSGRKDLKVSDIYIEHHNIWMGRWYFSNAYFYTYRADRCKAISSYNRGTNSKIISWDYVGKVIKKGAYQWWKPLVKNGKM